MNTPETPVGKSHNKTSTRFSRTQVAAKYPAEYDSRDPRHLRETRALKHALSYIPKGSHLLDLPCGTGRQTRLLLESGYRITAADISQAMVDCARENLENFREGRALPDIQYEVRDIVNTGYSDNSFDGVVCNRLFHHFTERSTRTAALAELARISRGPVILSFFNADTLGAKFRKFKAKLKGKQRTYRIPIPFKVFQQEFESQGFQLLESIPSRGNISPQWYVVLQKSDH